MLFEMPEVKSFMEGDKGITKSEKKEIVEKKMHQTEQKITKESADMIYQSRINKNKKGKIIINDDCNKQKSSFQKRLEEKKKKYLSSITVIPSIEEDNSSKDNNDSLKIHSRNDNNKMSNKLRNKSVDIVKPKYYNNDEDFNDEEIFENKNLNKFMIKKSLQLNINFSIDKNNFFDSNEKEEIKNNTNKLSSFSGSGTDSEKDTLSFNISDNNVMDISKFHKLTNKTLFKEKLKINFDVYICQYYNKFIENTMNSITKDYVQCGEEIEQKLYDNSIEFFNQRKELESIINIKEEEENKNNYNEQIQKAIDELKEEESNERIKIIEEGENKVEQLNNKYNNIEKMENDNYFEIIKEKLKLDVVNSLNSTILK